MLYDPVLQRSRLSMSACLCVLHSSPLIMVPTRQPCLSGADIHCAQICWDGGLLVCCDECPASYHFDCLGMTEEVRNAA